MTSFEELLMIYNMPKRVPQHEIDTQACRIVESKFESNWEIRELTGRDFGIDKVVERFENGYATSEILLLQIKGTAGKIDPDNPKFSLKTKTLRYAEMFCVPMLLIFVSIENSDACYYLWLQEYIRVRLQYENPNWRNQDYNTVYIPANNVLGSPKCIDHLTYISKFPKFERSWVQYYLALDDIDRNLPYSFDYENMSYEEILDSINDVESLLERARDCSEDIPQRLIPVSFSETINMIQTIKDMEEKPDKKDFIQVISNIMSIKASMQCIAGRFDSGYLRILYETEGTADY